MKCKELNFNYPDYVAEKVDELTKTMIEAHLSECESCRKEIESLKTVKSYLDTYQITEPEEKYFVNFIPRLNSKIDKEANIFSIPEWLTKVLFPALSLLTFFILIFNNVQINDKFFQNNAEESIAQIDTIIVNTKDALNIEPIESKIKYSTDYSKVHKKVSELLAQEILQSNNDEYLYPSESVETVVENLSDDQLDKVIEHLKTKPIYNK
jgi:hypothetical protein